MRRFMRPGSLLASAAAITFVLAACNPQGGGSTPTSGSAQASGGAGVTLQVKQGSMGAYLTDAAGNSLYVRTTDPANGSSCTGGCASTWPPLVVPAGQSATPGTGVTGMLGSFKRDDGSTQVTINGMALYHFSGDTAPGQTNGQGFNGIWFLAAPAGGPLGAPASGAPAPSSGTGPTPTSGGRTY